MKIFGLIRCMWSAHTPYRRKVRRTSKGLYIGYCFHCEAPIKRIHRDKWVRDWARSFGLGKKFSHHDKAEDPD